MVSFFPLNKSIKKISFKTKERYDKTKLKNIINCEDVDDDDKEVCKKIKQNLGRNVYLDVCYCIPDGQFANEDYIGRLYTDGNNYQKINKEIRNYLACDLYNDYDIKNCHPVILCELCKRFGIEVENVFKLKMRDELAVKFGISIDDLKAELKLVCNKETHRSKYAELNEIHDEIYKVIVPRFKVEFPEVFESVPNDKKYNRNGSFLVLVFNKFETMIVEKYIEFFKEKKKISVEVIIHDGFFIDKKKNVGVGMLAEADEYVFNELGMNVNLVNKPMKSKYQGFDFNKGYVDSDVLINDKYAGEKLIEMSDGEIIWCNTTQSLWHFNKNVGIWSKDVNSLESKITTEYADKLVFKQLDSRDNVKVYDYGGDVVKRRKMLEMAKSLAPKHDYFIEDNIDTSIGKLLFSNGIFHWDTKTFVEGFDKNIVFLYVMPCEFSYKFDKKRQELCRKYSFEDPFTTKQLRQGIDKYFIYWLSRRIQGIYDKDFVICEGLSNSGRSTTLEMLQIVFGNYIGEVEGNSFILKNNDEPEKNNKWLINNQYRRLNCASEPSYDDSKRNAENLKWDGSMLNKITGGDTIQARNLNERLASRGFRNRAGLIIFCNKLGLFAGDTKAISNRLRGIEYSKTFVDEIKNPDCHMIKDVSIRNEFIKHPDFPMAFFWLLVNAEKVDVPKCVMKYADEILDTSNTDMVFINTHFIIGGGFSNYVNRKEIEDLCKDNNKGYRHIRKMLINLGMRETNEDGRDRFTEDGKQVRRYFNIALK